MEGNYVAKYARKFNKHRVHRDKTKIRPPKKLTAGEIYELYDSERDATDSDIVFTEVHRRVGSEGT